MIKTRIRLFDSMLLILAVLSAFTALSGCGGGSNSIKTDELHSAQLELPKDLPFSPLLNKSAPGLRHDAFYLVKKLDSKGVPEESSANPKVIGPQERFITNGRGFVAFSEDPGSFSKYYLFNFSGHTSLLIDTQEHTLKAVTETPADSILQAYQDEKSRSAVPKDRVLGSKKIGDYDCEGFLYKVKGNDGIELTREDWFAKDKVLLVQQRIYGASGGKEITLRRFNPYCETTLLRLPEGFTLLK